MKHNAKYAQLYEEIKGRIQSGEIKQGARLPGENVLGKERSMSRQTVRQALDLLEKDGLIERKQGSGTYVSDCRRKRERTWNIGVVATYISEYIFPAILRGIESELSEYGYTPILCATQNRVDAEKRILEELMKKSIDGLIVEGTKSALPNPNIGLYEEIVKSGVPLIFFNGYYPALENQIHVVMDDKQGGMDAVDILMDHGHERIGGIFKSDDMQGVKRYAGYLNRIMERGLAFQDEWALWFHSENRATLFDREAERIALSLQGCSAVVCYNDEIAIKLINALIRAGINVPQDKAVISFDNSLLSAISAVGISSLDHQKEVMGSTVARKIIGMIEGRKEKSVMMRWGYSAKESV